MECVPHLLIAREMLAIVWVLRQAQRASPRYRASAAWPNVWL
jgi:hypothetical protein